MEKDSLMIIQVNRFKYGIDAALSLIGINGEFQCFGFECDLHLSSIPTGRYRITPRQWGTLHDKYTCDYRFRDIHSGMLWIRNVKNFKYPFIYCNATDGETEGCLQVGCQAVAETEAGEMRVFSNVEAYKDLYTKVFGEAIRGNLFIDFKDIDK